MAFTQPKPESAKCPDCGADVEIWSDEATGTCPSCSKTVIRTETQSCVDYCKYAKECLGGDKFKQYGMMKAAMRKPALIAAVEKYFGADRKPIEHAKKAVSYAESLLALEREADPNLVIAAAALYHIGVRDAAAHGDPSGTRSPEKEVSAAARAILTDLGYPEGFMREVCDIVSRHTRPPDEESLHVRLVHDADLLVVSERQRLKSGADLVGELLASFRTNSGRAVAVREARRS
jgi:hypothetical protein